MSTHAGVALGALLLTSANAGADGETTPMIGLAVVGGDAARTPEHDVGLAGVGLDLAWWHGRFGIATEGSARWSSEQGGARGLVLGASARLRLADRLLPSLLDPRDVELGLELQAIVERTWWNVPSSGVDPTAYGLGLAIRVRGAGDPDTTMLAESRFFLRVMAARWTELDAARSTTTMMPGGMTDRALTLLLGIGASWGRGTASYTNRFRPRPFESTLLW